jgi:SAM-dependent methyltransferase
MSDWVKKLFVDRSDLFMKFMDLRWAKTEELVNGIIKVLNSFGITSGNVLDLCCGNGRISVHMAKKGFRTVGVDISKAFLDDAGKKAREHGVVDMVTFLQGDVRRLKEVIGSLSQPFDVIVDAWTSIGFYSENDDLGTFKQARELSREGALLFITETMHSEFLAVKSTPTSYDEIDDIIRLESRKYDPITSQMNARWTFYKKHGNDLDFIDETEISHHVYSLSGLSSVLKKAGWETTACYGSFMTLQAMSPLTSLNVVAKAI